MLVYLRFESSVCIEWCQQIKGVEKKGIFFVSLWVNLTTYNSSLEDVSMTGQALLEEKLCKVVDIVYIKQTHYCLMWMIIIFSSAKVTGTNNVNII